MATFELWQVAIIFAVGGVGGFGLAQHSYEKIITSYQGYCEAYREMLDK